MRKIFRWTVGGVNDVGIRILCHSVYNLCKLFGDADYFICYNNLKRNQLKAIEKLPVTLIEQSGINTFLEKKGSMWALIPNRIDINAHEVFIDNDVVLYERPEAINLFLKSEELFFISHGLKKLYGNYKSIVRENINFNSGLYGIPPGFDFEKHIKNVYNPRFEQNFYDFQGIVSYILSNEKHMVIPLDDVLVLRPWDDFKFGKCGIHFVLSNKMFNKCWDYYRRVAPKVI